MHLNKDIFSPRSWRVQSPSGIVGFLKVDTEKYFSQLIFKMWILHKCFLKEKEMTALENKFCTCRTSYPEGCLYLSDGLGLLLASIHHHLQCAIFAKANQAWKGKAGYFLLFTQAFMFWKNPIRILDAMHVLLIDNMHHMIANCHCDYYYLGRFSAEILNSVKKSDSPTIMSEQQIRFPLILLIFNHCIL